MKITNPIIPGFHPDPSICRAGPHLYKIGGYYYLMIAEGGTDYTHMETPAFFDWFDYRVLE